MVTLENCSTTPVMVTVDGVLSSRGDITAWKDEPDHDARTLAPQNKLTISVAFAPQRHGRHVAQLQLGVDGEQRTVTLEGDAIDLDFERTSFYACGCTTPRAGGGAPIALAIALALVVLRPRRRRRRATAP
jgi:MYXO-CTERM domain-containing protein